MKKQTTKLALTRETLATLQSDALDAVAGGRVTGPTGPSLPPNTYRFCPEPKTDKPWEKLSKLGCGIRK